MFTQAITRKPASTFGDGLTTAGLGRPDYDRIISQHAKYVNALLASGLAVLTLEPDPTYPDAHFIEDTAIITPNGAVITRLGAETRRGEECAVETFLCNRLTIEYITAPATIDGSDVLQVGEHFFIGLSRRTNHEGIEQLGAFLECFGYTWTMVPVVGGAYLKSRVNAVDENTLILTEAFAALPAFAGYQHIIVNDGECYAANVIWANDCLIIPAGYPMTRNKLTMLGKRIIEVETSEIRKMDGGLTCMSLRF